MTTWHIPVTFLTSPWPWFIVICNSSQNWWNLHPGDLDMTGLLRQVTTIRFTFCRQCFHILVTLLLGKLQEEYVPLAVRSLNEWTIISVCKLTQDRYFSVWHSRFKLAYWYEFWVCSLESMKVKIWARRITAYYLQRGTSPKLTFAKKGKIKKCIKNT